MILGIFTCFLKVGGIEQINRHVTAVLGEVSQSGGPRTLFLSLNDPLGYHELEVCGKHVSFQGFGRRKFRFFAAALRAGLCSRLMYIGHPNLAPIGLLVKVLRRTVCYWVATYGWDVWRPLPLYRRLALREASGLTSLSRFTTERLVEVQKVDSGKIVLLPPAIEAKCLGGEGVDDQMDLRLPAGRILLMVGRLVSSEREKGVDVVIQSLQKIVKIVPDTFLVVVGDGDDRPRLERLARNTGVAKHVHFAGIIPDAELLAYYKACDIFVMPSSQEGFGIVFLEAMAFGKPVIAGRHGGTPEVVLDEETGFLVNYGDEKTLADRILQLLSDKELSERMGIAGRRRVEEVYTFSHFRRRLLDALGLQ